MGRNLEESEGFAALRLRWKRMQSECLYQDEKKKGLKDDDARRVS